MLPIRTILHPTDFSEHADWAFGLARSLARDYGARLIVVHVVTPQVAINYEALLPPEPRGYREGLQERLQQLAEREPKLPIEHHLVDGDAAAEILRMAKGTQSDLIVMGTHGRTGLGRLLVGSVTEEVVRNAPCPVLSLRTPLRPADAADYANRAKTGLLVRAEKQSVPV